MGKKERRKSNKHNVTWMTRVAIMAVGFGIFGLIFWAIVASSQRQFAAVEVFLNSLSERDFEQSFGTLTTNHQERYGDWAEFGRSYESQFPIPAEWKITFTPPSNEKSSNRDDWDKFRGVFIDSSRNTFGFEIEVNRLFFRDRRGQQIDYFTIYPVDGSEWFGLENDLGETSEGVTWDLIFGFILMIVLYLLYEGGKRFLKRVRD